MSIVVEPLHSDIKAESVATPPGAVPFRPKKRGSRRFETHFDEAIERRLHENAIVRLGLHRQAVYNLRRHVQRAVSRFSALLVADLTVFAVMRELIRFVRDESVFGSRVAALLQNIVPTGYLNGWQYAAALM